MERKTPRSGTRGRGLVPLRGGGLFGFFVALFSLDLQLQLQRVGSEGYVENEAREKYDFIRQGEIIFAFDNPELLRGYTEEEYQIIMDEMRD